MSGRTHLQGLPWVAAVAMLATAIVSYAGDGRAAPGVWRDHATGFAIAGYDPVAYHTQGKPVRGSDGVEHRWGGAVWRFVNSGNRDAFIKHPQVYAPRFAGYDPAALARGLTVEGSPAVWAIHEGRVFLFHDIRSLRNWRGNPGELTGLAEANWPKLGRNLPGASDR